jgi:ABC-type antimicrobial peptide transport system permease subunit
MSKVGLAVLILGLLGVLLGGGVLLVSLLLPTLTDGRTSWDEAMLGIIPGALLLAVSLVVAAAGVVVLVVKRKKAQPPTDI